MCFLVSNAGFLANDDTCLYRRDYEQRGVLDQYDPAMLDDRQQRGMTAEQRVRAEQEMAMRDRAGAGRRLPGMDDLADDGGACPPCVI